MKILYATDHIGFLVNNKVYLSNRIYPILNRYANAFGEIVLYSRFIVVDTAPDDTFYSPFIVQHINVGNLKRTFLYNKELDNIIPQCKLVVGRVPALPAYQAIDYAKKRDIPTFTETMGCAWDAYWNHGLIGKIFAPYMYCRMRALVKNADYASYVTSSFLQRRYPRNKKSLSASNVLIKDINDSVLSKRIEHIQKRPPNTMLLMTTAAVNVRYKGQEYVLRAITKLIRQGINVKYYLVGDGDNSYLLQLARKLNIEERIVFTGRKSLNEVFELLDEIDVYLQPSLQEGLPRSVIEAMSRACVVIGAKTAGIPELIEPGFVVNKKSVDEITKCLITISKYTIEQNISVAKRNFEKAKEYQEEVLNEKRMAYYQEVIASLSSKN